MNFPLYCEQLHDYKTFNTVYVVLSAIDIFKNEKESEACTCSKCMRVMGACWLYLVVVFVVEIQSNRFAAMKAVLFFRELYGTKGCVGN